MGTRFEYDLPSYRGRPTALVIFQGGRSALHRLKSVTPPVVQEQIVPEQFGWSFILQHRSVEHLSLVGFCTRW